MNIKLLSISLLVFLTACQPAIDQAKVAKIDSLQQSIDSSQQMLAQLDTTMMFNYANHYFDNINYIKSTFNDTIETETAFFIDKYYGMRKTMKLMQSQYHDNAEELQITKQQLSDLKHDAEEGLLEEKQFDKYLELESENVLKVKSLTNQLVDAYEATIPAYDEMNPKIDSLIAEDKKDKKKMKGANS